MNIQNTVQRLLLPILFLFFTLFILSIAPVALAQSAAGIGISPAIVEPAKQFNPGDVEEFTVEISNLNTVDQTFYLTTRDIIGVREGGVPIFAVENSQKTGYEISDWLTLSVNELFLRPGETANVTFLMTVPALTVLLRKVRS